MKNKLITLILLVAAITSGYAQDKLKIGEVKNGKLVITNMDALKGFFMNSLGKSGTLGIDYQVSAAPSGDRFFVYFPVSGNKDKVSSIGIMLVKIKNDAFIVENSKASAPGGPGGGGSLEIQCIGVDCNICVPNITWVGNNWIPEVFCECRQTGGGQCNMITKIVIHVDV
jgi:hypothetical protein